MVLTVLCTLRRACSCLLHAAFLAAMLLCGLCLWARQIPVKDTVTHHLQKVQTRFNIQSTTPTPVQKDSSTRAIKGCLYNSNRGLPAAMINHNFDSQQRQWDRNIFIQASYNKNFGERYSLMLSAKYVNDYTRYLYPEITNTQGLPEDKYNEHELYFPVANRYHISSFRDIALAAYPGTSPSFIKSLQ
jgi:hypothetical protein